MSNSKTRVRVARIAAGAVFAAGASLTAAGTAQALDIGVDLGLADANVSLDEKGLGVGLNATSGVDGGADGGEDNGGADGGEDNGGVDGGADGGEDNGGVDGGADGGEDNGGVDGGVDGGADGGEDNGGGENGGPATTGGDSGGDDTCVVNGEEVDCEDAAPATTGGGTETEPIVDERPKEELAETGSGQTTFLLVGAATMIAGGVGFRMLPRVLNRGAAA